MGKIIIILSSFILLLQAGVEKDCLSCHKEIKVPNKLIYKRYLMKYSTKEYMKEAIISYLKNPNTKNSIMPSVFFSKFPIKEAMRLDKKVLERDVLEYLDKFDVKKKLIL